MEAIISISLAGFPDGTSGKEHTSQRRRLKRHGFSPWVGKIPWRGAQEPTRAFLPGESHGQRSLAGSSPWGLKESAVTWHKRLCLSTVFSLISFFLFYKMSYCLISNVFISLSLSLSFSNVLKMIVSNILSGFQVVPFRTISQVRLNLILAKYTTPLIPRFCCHTFRFLCIVLY